MMAAGDLDASFGVGGLVADDPSTAKDEAGDIVLQADGKIVAGGWGSGDAFLRRYTSSGAADASFGIGGVALIDLKGNWTDSLSALIAQPDGKILAAITSHNPQDWTFPYDARFGLARFTPDGALDKTFGSKGKVVTDLGNGWESITGIALQSDGKIVVSANSNGSAGRSGNFIVARYTASGALDTTFGGVGYVITDFGAIDNTSDLAIQADNKIVVVGSSGNSIAAARYNPNGTLDTSFGTGGKVLTGIADEVVGASDVHIQSDGGIVVAAGHVAVRYLPANGGLDPAFGVGGMAPLGGGVKNATLVAQSDGKLVLAGSEDFYENLGGGDEGMSSRFALTRISGVDGSVDTSFGVGGWVYTYVTQPGRRALNRINAAVIEPDGDILGAGMTGLWDSTGRVNDQITLVRYLGDDPQAALAAARHDAALDAWLADDTDESLRRKSRAAAAGR